MTAMPDPMSSPRSISWRIGDRAIVSTPNAQPSSFEATVVSSFTITGGDAEKLRIKYPAIAAGELVLVLKDASGRSYHRIASDPHVQRIITPPQPGGS